MPIKTTFKAAVQRLAELAGTGEPGYVSVRAAGQLANILSPANPRHADITRALSDDPPTPVVVKKDPAGADEHPYACYAKGAEESEEDEESEGPQSDDEPP
ncbi:MAG: hypothetical protein F4X58_08310 [Chloroflexi bacterium]|nr:hypothetical protein [Chloroflexota bacterium]MYC01912.1 hypothetical protein [Chloroflexota bacterium]